MSRLLTSTSAESWRLSQSSPQSQPITLGTQRLGLLRTCLSFNFTACCACSTLPSNYVAPPPCGFCMLWQLKLDDLIASNAEACCMHALACMPPRNAQDMLIRFFSFRFFSHSVRQDCLFGLAHIPSDSVVGAIRAVLVCVSRSSSFDDLPDLLQVAGARGCDRPRVQHSCRCVLLWPDSMGADDLAATLGRTWSFPGQYGLAAIDTSHRTASHIDLPWPMSW